MELFSYANVQKLPDHMVMVFVGFSTIFGPNGAGFARCHFRAQICPDFQGGFLKQKLAEQ